MEHTMMTWEKFKPNHYQLFLMIGLFILLVVLAPHAYAGTDGAELKPAVEKVEGLIKGLGGKLICLVSLGLALVSSVLKFNPYVVIGCLGVCLTTALGVGMVDTIVTALI